MTLNWKRFYKYSKILTNCNFHGVDMLSWVTTGPVKLKALYGNDNWKFWISKNSFKIVSGVDCNINSIKKLIDELRNSNDKYCK